MPSIKKLLTAAAGSAGGDKVYVEDVFSTYLYDGNSTDNTAVNTGLDMSGEGGLVWNKRLDGYTNHILIDTARGVEKYISSDDTAAESNYSNSLKAFTSTGYTMGTAGNYNGTGGSFASWNFRKQKGFFDLVKFSTTGGGGQQTVSHNLGSIPGTIILKQITSGADGYWYVINKNVTSPNSNWWLNYANLNVTAGFGYWGSTAGIYSAPTSSAITVSTYFTNQTADFIAYFFAEGGSDDQIFGDNGDEAIIKCGTATTNAAGVLATDVDLGFEPQFFLVKGTAGGAWNLFDTMRGFNAEKVGNNKYVRPNTNAPEGTNASVDGEFITSTGFGTNGNGVMGSANATFIYLAIRRGPMKEPSAGTEVYKALAYTGNGNNNDKKDAGFPIDLIFNKSRDSNGADAFVTRLLGAGTATKYLTPSANYDEQAGVYTALGQTDWQTGNGSVRWYNTNTYTYISWMFKRAPKFMDVVCYAGAGGNADVTHNLGVAPEMMIVKARDKSEGWAVQAYPALSLVSRVGFLNTTNPFSGNSQFNGAPTATVFKVGNSGNTNESGYNYVAYLFATLPNVSKIGFYDGTGATINIDCGFSSPARFVMIKRADAGAGPDNWFVFDSVRGISVGNDPWLAVNTTAAEVTTNDYISTYASGFTVSATTASGINENYGDYIFLAIA